MLINCRGLTAIRIAIKAAKLITMASGLLLNNQAPTATKVAIW